MALLGDASVRATSRAQPRASDDGPKERQYQTRFAYVERSTSTASPRPSDRERKVANFGFGIVPVSKQLRADFAVGDTPAGEIPRAVGCADLQLKSKPQSELATRGPTTSLAPS